MSVRLALFFISPLFSASASAFRSFTLFTRIPLAFAPFGNKRPLTLGIGGIGCDIVSGGALAHGDVSGLTPGIVAWAAELTPGHPLR